MGSVVFTRSTKTHDRTTDELTETETTIQGEAVKVSGDPVRYRKLELIESEAPTLQFVPDTYGDRIQPGDTTLWRNLPFTARDCQHLEPDGVVIKTKVIIAP